MLWHTKKYDKQLLRNKIFSRYKYRWSLLRNPSQREKEMRSFWPAGLRSLHFVFTVGGASSQVNYVGNDCLCWFRWSWQWFKGDFSVQSVTTSWPQTPDESVGGGAKYHSARIQNFTFRHSRQILGQNVFFWRGKKKLQNRHDHHRPNIHYNRALEIY